MELSTSSSGPGSSGSPQLAFFCVRLDNAAAPAINPAQTVNRYNPVNGMPRILMSSWKMAARGGINSRQPIRNRIIARSLVVRSGKGLFWLFDSLFMMLESSLVAVCSWPFEKTIAASADSNCNRSDNHLLYRHSYTHYPVNGSITRCGQLFRGQVRQDKPTGSNTLVRSGA